MNLAEWRHFLAQWSREAARLDGYPTDHSRSPLAPGWLGYDGATEEQIIRAELRLAVTLPPSYRTFLKASNGWRFVDSVISKLWSIEEIEWFTMRHHDWIDQWMEGVVAYLPGTWSVSDEDYFVYGDKQDGTLTFRDQYLQAALEISPNDPDTSAIYLLNPKILTPEGEWEAWFFANWLPGAYRYRSFEDLMVAEHASFLSHRDY